LFRSQVLQGCRNLNQLDQSRPECIDCTFEFLVLGFLSNQPSVPCLEQIRTSAVQTKGREQDILLNVQVCAHMTVCACVSNANSTLFYMSYMHNLAYCIYLHNMCCACTPLRTEGKSRKSPAIPRPSFN
jgi:hypothetical protein